MPRARAGRRPPPPASRSRSRGRRRARPPVTPRGARGGGCARRRGRRSRGSDLAEHAGDPVDVRGRGAGRRLVDEQHARPGGERRASIRSRCSLPPSSVAGRSASASRPTSRSAAAATSRASASRPAPSASRAGRAPPRLPAALEARADRRVVEHGAVAEERRRLEGAHDAGERAGTRAARGELLTVEEHDALVGRQRAGEQPQRGRLAGAVRTDQRRDGARLEREVEPVDGHVATEVLAEPARFEAGRPWPRKLAARPDGRSPPGQQLGQRRLAADREHAEQQHGGEERVEPAGRDVRVFAQPVGAPRRRRRPRPCRPRLRSRSEPRRSARRRRA